jgi:hypothetical protein
VADTTITWSTLISPEDWYRLRLELVENGLPIPYSQGMAQNRKTGYQMSSRYDRPIPGFKVGRLTLVVTPPEDVPAEPVVSFLNKLFTFQENAA